MSKKDSVAPNYARNERILHDGENYLSEDLFPVDFGWQCYVAASSDGNGYTVSPWGRVVLTFIHEVFQSGDINGERFADVCSGSSLLGGLSASGHFKKIYMTEYSPHCRSYLQRWLDGEERVHDWIPCLKLVADLEGKSIAVIEERLCKSICCISSCDLRQDQPFEEAIRKEMLPLDCILSCLTLEVAAQSKESYKQLISNLASWLRPGGYLILIGTVQQTFYSVGTKLFRSLPVDVSELKDMLKRADMEVVREQEMSIEDIGINREDVKDALDAAGCVLMLARKIT